MVTSSLVYADERTYHVTALQPAQTYQSSAGQRLMSWGRDLCWKHRRSWRCPSSHRQHHLLVLSHLCGHRHPSSYRYENFPQTCKMRIISQIRIKIVIDLFLSFPQNFEFLFYDHYLIIMVVEQKFLQKSSFFVLTPVCTLRYI